MTEKNRSPPLSDGTSTEAIEPTILFQKGQVHLYGIKIRYPQHGKDIRQLGVCRRRQNRTEKNQRTHGGTPAAPHPTRPVQNDTAPVIPERKRAAPAVKESNFTIRRTTARKEWTKTVKAAAKQKKGEKP